VIRYDFIDVFVERVKNPIVTNYWQQNINIICEMIS